MFLDIAVGIIASIVTSNFFGFELTTNWVLLGAAFALLPDIDIFYEGLKRRGVFGGNKLGAHREWTHYPMLYPIVGLISWYIWGAPIAILLVVGLFWHVLHDSVSIGWGIQWLAPFNHTHYKFFAQQDGQFTWKNKVVAWKKGEVEHVVAQHGNPNWIRDIYLRPTLVSVTEFTSFLAALLILYFYLK